MIIPILENHSQAPIHAIGTFDGGDVVLGTPIHDSDIANVFGNVGYRIMEIDNAGYIKKLKILEWSVVHFPNEHKDKLRRDAYIIKLLEEVENRRLTAVEAAQMIVGTGKEYK